MRCSSVSASAAAARTDASSSQIDTSSDSRKASPQTSSTPAVQLLSTCTKAMQTTCRVTGSGLTRPSFSTFSTWGMTNSPSFCTISPRQRAASVRLVSLSLVNMEKHSCVSSPSSFFSVRGVLFTTDFHTWKADWRT